MGIGRWSRAFDRCVKCRTKSIKHKGRGLCIKCWDKIRTHRRIEYFRCHDRYKRRRQLNPSVGFLGEIETEKLLGVEKARNNFGADFNWRGKRIEVKTSKLHSGRWKFLLYRQKGKTDFFLFILKDDNLKTVNMYLIPDKDLKRNNFAINRNKTDKYKRYLFDGR